MMSDSRHAELPTDELRLDAAVIEVLALRVAELLANQLPTPPSATGAPGRLLSATEVSEWWGVSRGWVYEHATELGAIRIGDGERPRLRFDPEQVARRLQQQPTVSAPKASPQRIVRARRSPRMRGDSRPLAFRADPELSSLRNDQEMAGRRANAPGRGADDDSFGTMTSLPPASEAGVGRSYSRPTFVLRRHDHRR
jgi:hypothetical protein